MDLSVFLILGFEVQELTSTLMEIPGWKRWSNLYFSFFNCFINVCFLLVLQFSFILHICFVALEEATRDFLCQVQDKQRDARLFPWYPDRLNLEEILDNWIDEIELANVSFTILYFHYSF